MMKKMRIMTERPLNAETPFEHLRSWITNNDVFFKRNQGQIPETPADLSHWQLKIDGLVKKKLVLTHEAIERMPRTEVANTMECSGNSRSLLKKKASGNPWTIGGVGNAVWGGVWLKVILEAAGLKKGAAHVCFEGLDQPLGSSGIKFVRSIPLEKAMDSTLLAYEMNGKSLPLEHGFPLRTLALGWTGANCVKWLHRITLLDRPYEGFFMDKVYRIFQKGQDPGTGEVVKDIRVKAIITEPSGGETLSEGTVAVRGAGYAGEAGIDRVEVSPDGGSNWYTAKLIGPCEPFAWRRWEYMWNAEGKGEFTIMARATDTNGNRQPENARWNVLGYGNNGVREHAVVVRIV